VALGETQDPPSQTERGAPSVWRHDVESEERFLAPKTALRMTGVSWGCGSAEGEILAQKGCSSTWQVPLNAGFSHWMHLWRLLQKGLPGCNQVR